MIKISKPHRYANWMKISRQGMNDNEYVNSCKQSIKDLKRLPKNVLKAKILRCEISANGDDIIHDRMTMRVLFEVIKFKR